MLEQQGTRNEQTCRKRVRNFFFFFRKHFMKYVSLGDELLSVIKVVHFRNGNYEFWFSKYKNETYLIKRTKRASLFTSKQIKVPLSTCRFFCGGKCRIHIVAEYIHLLYQTTVYVFFSISITANGTYVKYQKEAFLTYLTHDAINLLRS